MKKEHTTFCITKELKEVMDYLIAREDIPSTLFLKRAIRMFLDGKQVVDDRVLIKQRKHPDYIRRDTTIGNYVEPEQMRQMKKLTEEKGYNLSQIVFQALVEYCAYLITLDDTGIVIKDK